MSPRPRQTLVSIVMLLALIVQPLSAAAPQLAHATLLPQPVIARRTGYLFCAIVTADIPSRRARDWAGRGGQTSGRAGCGRDDRAGVCGRRWRGEAEVEVETRPARTAKALPPTADKLAAKTLAEVAPPPAEPPKATRSRKPAAEPITSAPATTATKPAAQASAPAAPSPTESPKPTRTRGKAVAVDAAQLALLAEPPAEAPEKQPRSTTRSKAAPATPPEPPKALSGRARAVTQPKPTAGPAKQAVTPPAPARPAARTATKTSTKTPAPPAEATPSRSATQGKATDKIKPPDKPAPPASTPPVASRKGGTRKSGS